MATNSIDPANKVEIDYARYDDKVQKLQPTVYRDGDSFCCLSGPDAETGIYGCGSSPDEAVKNWRSELYERFNRLHSGGIKPDQL